MKNDEQQIRDLFATWMAAPKSGDTAAVLELMTDGGKWRLAWDANLLAPV